MSRQLATPKRLLTHYCNKLETAIRRCKEENLETISVASIEQEPPGFAKETAQILQETVAMIEEATTKIKEVLQNYSSIIDAYEELPQTEVEDFDSYSERAQITMVDAYDYVLMLKARLYSFERHLQNVNEVTIQPSPFQGPKPHTELPILPIPTFNGNIWEWDNFWEIYNFNIHQQNIPELYKFNYLLNALRGEPLEAIKKFQPNKENYIKAITFLRRKYGNPEELIFHLINNLEKCQLRSNSVREQRKLLEELQTIVAQLVQKGENVDNQMMIRKIIAKFPIPTQRKALDRNNDIGKHPISLDQMFQYLEETITKEEVIALYTTQEQKPPINQENIAKIPKLSCMYCTGNHKPYNCSKYTTPQQRAQYLRENNLCWICASPNHNSFQCKRSTCFRCQGHHNTSCCQQPQVRHKPPTTDHQIKPSRKIKQTNKVNQVSNEAPKEIKIMEIHSNNNNGNIETTFLPTAEITVLNPSSNTLENVPILLDTGAEVSFIDSKLAETLNLPRVQETKLRLQTFGSEEVKESASHKVQLEAWDSNGDPLHFDLFTHNILTKSLTTPTISTEDIDFIRQNSIPFKLPKNNKIITPLILIGCDQIWSLLKHNEAQIKLPSGLHLIPTRMGHVISGKTKIAKRMYPHNEESNKWDRYWTLESRVNTVTVMEDEDSKNWDNYWTLDSAGTEEYSNSEKEIKAIVDKQVWKQFNETIQKREDGYYVRLPWKELSSPLPDNRAIALHRLASTWKTLKKNKELLDMYNNVFSEQIHLNILEEVPKATFTNYSRVHYIPHQAVLTPQKTTTKLRIVYDASAHYKGCPSLNDALHQGPVILPQLFGVMLRFRIGRIAITADVEKAFLQVRLHEDDRDATRCLWLHNHTKAPHPDNIKTLRFTRVTFGLNTSPFLLAGTIYFHLDQYENDSELVAKIKDNLYVDNLVLTVETLEESKYIYSKTKQIFNDLNMNLRQFVSNSTDLMNNIDERDRSASLENKVLGISWNPVTDCLLISCTPQQHQTITKRAVASTLASIYDPLGYLLPLTHKAKVFLRELWKENYDWDSILPKSHQETWKRIVKGMQGFQKQIPRCVATKGPTYSLITFADASTEGIAACVYLHTTEQTNILIAKGKLPSLKLSITIPKLELDAVTLAFRITNSALSQLHQSLIINDIFILTDSEIVQNWIKHRPPPKVGTRIINRLMEIEKITENLRMNKHRVFFGHVASQQNVADCATRGLTQQELSHHCWWSGPSFLHEPSNDWKTHCKIFEMNGGTSIEQSEINSNAETVDLKPIKEEEGIEVLTTRIGHPNSLATEEIFEPLKKFSLTNIKRILVLVLRYIKIIFLRTNGRRTQQWTPSTFLRSIRTNRDLKISGEEITIAEKILVKQHQQSKITLSILQNMKHLNIKPDTEGLLRCMGRLGRSQLDTDTKYPLIILQNSFLAELIIRDCHNKGHPGIAHTMAIIRQKYWIPKLRAQVKQIIRHCMQCQRFNNLPFRYPQKGDLPEKRVQRSRPFEHVGLDYFGPLTVVHPSDTETKCYGAIITCMATRLIHLDIVSDLTTDAFLMMLRRFFSRRGLPKSIISDNAPTFIMGEAILSECLKSILNDPTIERAIANREIEWKHITPFAPWQGGFYERLIKSVKYSLYKSLNRTKLSFEHLLTVIIEIEALLNTRPLLYMESNSPWEQVLRPIDFLQNQFEVPYPLDGLQSEIEDPSFLPSDQQILIRSKRQAIAALQSSCKHTERFWQIWKTQYLTSLREKDQIDLKRNYSKLTPKEQDIVLIMDPIQPRHSWKIGRIHQLVSNSEGIVREAVITLPSQHNVRRPINLLVPLEMEDTFTQQNTNLVSEPENTTNHEPKESSNTHPYNLRSKKPVDYKKLASLLPTTQLGLLINIIFVLAMIGQYSEANPLMPEKIRQIICINGGVELTSPDQMAYEICADHFCKTYINPQPKEIIRFPPQLTLHEHQLQWKFIQNNTIGNIETTCPASSFCEQIQCTFCSTVIFNPECWPLTAILLTTVIIYFIITGCYVFLYVPITLGRPIRLLSSFIWRQIHSYYNSQDARPPRSARKRPLDVMNILALTAIITLSSVETCQQVDIFSHTSTICVTEDNNVICHLKISEVLKINPFKKEACFKLLQNDTTLHEIRIQWKSLMLTCEPETDMFTRDTTYHVVDSKRCPHTGSCKGTKCTKINASSLLPELERGNNYPGITACVESCGGPGCDCFYWSSGCLFYRIYLVPKSSKVFEIFHCDRWLETAAVKITHIDTVRQRTNSYIANLRPNIPLNANVFTFILSSITVPPTPLLNTPFLTDGNYTSVWNYHITPPLRCQNRSAAQKLSCEISEDCTCNPAEIQANCKCKEVHISSWFNNIQHRLPITHPSVSFRQDERNNVVANIPTMTTAEIVVDIQSRLMTNILVDDITCKIEDTTLSGCYHCAKGAFTNVTCTSPKPTQAEVTCLSSSFTVLCDKTGKQSTIYLSFNKARVKENCNVTCGSTHTSFEINGILKYTSTAQDIFNTWLESKSTTDAKIELPDFEHIIDVFLQWYKVWIAALIGLILLLSFTYIYFSIFGL